MDKAAFEGGLVGIKNVGYDASVHLTIALPQELGAAIIAAFGWPTVKNPIPVAIARIDEGAAQKGPKEREHRRFNALSPAEQAGILCRDPEFPSFCEHGPPTRAMSVTSGMTGAGRLSSGLLRRSKSRADIKEGTEAHRQWRVILERYRRWQNERDRLDVDF
jgi:hypothetical protein